MPLQSGPVLDVISLVASVASVILAVGAIWLSIVFYRMSAQASTATTEAAKGIAASVERLEKLFDKLYSDTFSMMRDTVSDMRKHIWPAEDSEPDKAIEETQKKADEKIAELKIAIDHQLSDVLQRQKLADDRVSTVRSEMRRLLDRAIIGSRQVETEAREETIREHILRSLRLLRERQPRTAVEDLITVLPFPTRRVVNELGRMREEGLIEMNSDSIVPATLVRLARTEPMESEQDRG